MLDRTGEEAAPPRLVDRSGLRAELGVSAATADEIFRRLPTVRIPGIRREWLKREDLEAALERWTVVDSAIRR